MVTDEIRKEMFLLQDKAYRDLQGRLIPSVAPDRFIGVRTPELRKMAKRMGRRGDIREFLEDLPHLYFDENQLHAFLISEIRDFPACLDAVNGFLPYIDNWATCDQMSPKAFRKHRPELLDSVKAWLACGKTYEVRFGLKMLMDHYLDDLFDPAYPEMAAAVRSGEYYVRMMAAWYFATALAKQYDAVIPLMEGHRLDPWVHRKAIQKATASYRISPEQKAYLRSLKQETGSDSGAEH